MDFTAVFEGGVEAASALGYLGVNSTIYVGRWTEEIKMPASENALSRKSQALSLAILAIALPLGSGAQGQPATLTDEVSLAREFLRSFYPDLNEKKYALSISTAAGYDDPASTIQNLELAIGDYPKEWAMGYGGGWRGDKPKPKDFQPGPIHPQQYMIADFGFDKGSLVGLVVRGSRLGNSDAKTSLGALVHSQPEMSDAEADAALKGAGAKYGRADKQAFLQSLRISELEKFFGKIDVTSAELRGLDLESKTRDPYWPDWTVMARSKRPDGSAAVIRMYFEPFKGDLEALYVEANP